MSTAEQKSGTTTQTVETTTPLVDQILKEGRIAKTSDDLDLARSSLKVFIDQALRDHQTLPKSAEKAINFWIAEIDRLLSAQLNEIMHHEAFQKLESSWRGLHYLVRNTELGTDLRIRVLNVGKDELLRDLEDGAKDQSQLFQKVYEAEYGIYGGYPFGVLLGDYEFGKHPQDINLLARIGEVAAMAHAPFISAASSRLFGMDSFAELSNPYDLKSLMDTVEYAKWKSFRDAEDSRYVGLTLPHVLIRLPYGRDTVPVKAFDFSEDVDGRDHRKYLWGNAAYAFGARITESFKRYGWLARIRGPESGGAVLDLPVHTFPTDDGGVDMKCPTEIGITDRRENELAELGFIALAHKKGHDLAAFFSAQSCQKPQLYDTDEANANARLSTALQYMLCVSRIAHYLKVIARDKIGGFMERADCEKWLQRWINNYVLEKPDEAGDEMKAKRPLREARITVEEVPGKPGWYRAVAHLRPHFQFEGLNMSLRLVAELPQTAKK
jgi:type VI secretion system protein ImpC